MIERLVHASVMKRGWVLGSAIVASVALGVFALQLSFDALPDITPNQVQILTRAPGLTPEEVERLVSRPIETALGGMPGLATQRSTSQAGLSEVVAIFEDGADPYRARQLVQERLATVTVPEGVEPPEMGPHSGGLGEIYQFTIESPLRTPAELLELVEIRIAPILRAVPGVVEVNSWGGEERTLAVEADPQRMAARGISLEELREALEKATGSAGGESLSAGGGRALIRGIARPQDPSELAAAVIHRSDDGEIVRVGDVATVEWGARPRIGTATANGRGEVVYVMAQMLRGENALEVVGRIQEVVPDLERALPEDVTFRLVYDRSNLVNATLRTVTKNLGEGGLLVVLVLFLMLGSLRAGLLVATAIPFSMLFAAAGMVIFGIPGNLMSLGAIDFGLLVDGAVVMVEAIFRRLDPKRNRDIVGLVQDRRERQIYIAQVAASVARPVFFAVVVILLVYTPIVSLSGVDGKMFRPMALTMIFALTGALFYSLTVVPALSSWLLRPRDVPKKDPLLVRLVDAIYARILPKTMARPVLVAVVAVLALGVSGLVLSRIGTEFIPQLDEGDLVLQVAREPDISVETAIREANHLEATLLAAAPEVIQVASRIGSPAVATDPMGLEESDIFIHLKPRDQWRKGLSREALIAELERAMETFAPGGEAAFTQPIQMRFNEMVAGETTDVALSIFGEDLEELRRLAESARDTIAGIEGATDVRVTTPPNVTMLEVVPDPLLAAQAGLNARDVLDAVTAIRVGLPVGTTWEGPIEIPILLHVGRETSAFELGRHPIVAEGGRLVPLSSVAELRTLETPSSISHDDGQRRIVVGFNIRGRDLGQVAEEAREAVAELLAAEEGIRWVWGGQIENLASAQRRLAVVVPVVLLAIALLLLSTFQKLRPALILLLQIPFATVGGIWALWLRDMPLSISAMIGFIALSGIATLNGVVLMHRLLENERKGLPAREAAREAALTRVRPVLMTALVAGVGFVPMATATGIGAEVQRPLATVVVAGLVTSTALTLLVLPSIFPWFERRRRTPVELEPPLVGDEDRLSTR